MKNPVILFLILAIQSVYADYVQLGNNLAGLFGESTSVQATGNTVAIDADGQTAVAGYPAYNSNRGIIRVYKFNGSAWSETASVQGSVSGERFGESVDISADGRTIVVGAPSYTNSGISYAGRAEIFSVNVNGQNLSSLYNINAQEIDITVPGYWTQEEQTISVPYLVPIQFCQSVRDCWWASWLDWIFGSCPMKEVCTTTGWETKYRDETTTVDVYVEPTTRQEIAAEKVGSSVSISDDGYTVAIGFPEYDNGRVGIFTKNGSSWEAHNINGGSNGSKAGSVVALSGDGNRLAIGESGANQVQTYQRSGNSWNNIGTITGGSADKLGYAADLNTDGTKLVIGARGASSAKGVVRLYDKSSGTWTQVGGDILGESSEDFSGWSVSINGDGTSIVFGAPFRNFQSGQLSIYRGDGALSEVKKINGNTKSFLGSSVAISRDNSRVIVSSPGVNTNSTPLVSTYYDPQAECLMTIDGKKYGCSTGGSPCNDRNITTRVKQYINNGQPDNNSSGSANETVTTTLENSDVGYFQIGNLDIEIDYTASSHAGCNQNLKYREYGVGLTEFPGTESSGTYSHKTNYSRQGSFSFEVGLMGSEDDKFIVGPKTLYFENLFNSCFGGDPMLVNTCYIDTPYNSNVTTSRSCENDSLYKRVFGLTCENISYSGLYSSCSQSGCHSFSKSQAIGDDDISLVLDQGGLSQVSQIVKSESNDPGSQNGEQKICTMGNSCQPSSSISEAILTAGENYSISLAHPQILLAPTGDSAVIKHKFINDNTSGEVYSESTKNVILGSNQPLISDTTYDEAGYLWYRAKFFGKWYYFRVYFKPHYFFATEAVTATTDLQSINFTAYNKKDQEISNWKSFDSPILTFTQDWPSYTTQDPSFRNSVDFTNISPNSELKNNQLRTDSWDGSGPAYFRYDDVAKLSDLTIRLGNYYNSNQLIDINISNNFTYDIYPYDVELTFDDAAAALEFNKTTVQQNSHYGSGHFYANTSENTVWTFAESKYPTFTLKGKNWEANFLRNYFPADGYVLNGQYDVNNSFPNILEYSFTNPSPLNFNFSRDQQGKSAVQFYPTSDFQYVVKFKNEDTSGEKYSSENLGSSSIKMSATFSQGSLSVGPVAGDVGFNPIEARWGRTIAQNITNIDNITSDKNHFQGLLNITLQYKDNSGKWKDEDQIAPKLNSFNLDQFTSGPCKKLEDGQQTSTTFTMEDSYSSPGQLSFLLKSDKANTPKKCDWTLTDPFSDELSAKVIFGVKSDNTKGLIFELGQ